MLEMIRQPRPHTMQRPCKDPISLFPGFYYLDSRVLSISQSETQNYGGVATATNQKFTRGDSTRQCILAMLAVQNYLASQ